MQPSFPRMEFHVSRQARDYYQFDQSLFSLNGNVIFANFYGARIFAQKMNQKRDLVRFPEQAIRAGQINAMGLIDEILHFVVSLYRQQINPKVMQEAESWLVERLCLLKAKSFAKLGSLTEISISFLFSLVIF